MSAGRPLVANPTRFSPPFLEIARNCTPDTNDATGTWLAQLRAAMLILSHRGNIVGPCPSAENRLPTVDAALRWHWGLETDIRRDATGRFYIAHDPRESGAGFVAEDFCALFRANPNATIALNVKELGYEAELLEFLEAQRVIDQVYLFDMELLEKKPGATAKRLRQLHPTVRIAARVSDRGESMEQALAIEEASVIWLDEFDGRHFTAKDVQRLKRAGRTVHAVSPDLHRASYQAARSRWMEFLDYGVDGICTDYPAALDRLLRTVSEKAA